MKPVWSHLLGPLPLVFKIFTRNECKSGDLVKTTLGPNGMDKILQSADPERNARDRMVTVTNDGATILR